MLLEFYIHPREAKNVFNIAYSYRSCLAVIGCLKMNSFRRLKIPEHKIFYAALGYKFSVTPQTSFLPDYIMPRYYIVSFVMYIFCAQFGFFTRDKQQTYNSENFSSSSAFLIGVVVFLFCVAVLVVLLLLIGRR